MRINIEIDEKLIKEAMCCLGATTEREVIENAQRLLVRLKSQEEVRNLRGQLHWEGDLETTRLSRVPVKDN